MNVMRCWCGWWHRARGAMAVGLAILSTTVAAQALPPGCGDLGNHYGPFDFRVDKEKLGVVEHYHFTPAVESLKSGVTGQIGDDLDYTLRAFPNHHRALMAMIRLGQRDGVAKPRGARYTVACYVARAEAFKPDDGMVKMLAGVFLLQNGHDAEAAEKLEAAAKLEGGNANLHYNLGLAYFRLKKFDSALEHAHKAYALGFQLPGLRSMLERAGQWREPSSSANAAQ